MTNKEICQYRATDLCEAYCNDETQLCREISSPEIVFNAFALIEKERQAYKDRQDFDQLTGLYSRQTFFELGNDYLTQANDRNQSVGCIVFDINNFKKFNDTNGHIKGDGVLQHLGEALNNELRKDDFLVTRFGGDEFVVLCNLEPRNPDAPMNDEERLGAISERFSLVVNDSLKSHAKYLSASFGQEISNGSQNINELIDLADQRMYKNKKRQKATFTD